MNFTLNRLQTIRFYESLVRELYAGFTTLITHNIFQISCQNNNVGRSLLQERVRAAVDCIGAFNCSNLSGNTS